MIHCQHKIEDIMSFEGYYQVLCKKGHLTNIDCYEEPILSKELCPPFIELEDVKLWTCYCGSEAAWWNLVDVTNGSFDLDGTTRIDNYIKLQENSPVVTCNCGTCGNAHILKNATYKVPELKGHKVKPLSELFGAWAESEKEAPPPPPGPPTRLIKEGVGIVKNPKLIGWNMEEVQGMLIINYDEDPIKMANLVKQGTHRYVLKSGSVLAVQPMSPSAQRAWIETTKGFRIEHTMKVYNHYDVGFIPRIGDMATVFSSRDEAQKALDAYKDRFINQDEIEEFDASTKIIEI